MKLYEIILEARAESLATKYRDKILDRAKRDRHSGVSDESSILSFVQNLETKFKRYVEWVLLRWLGGNFLIEDMPRVEAAIAEFDAKKRGLERKDINQYRTLSDLEDTVGLLDHIKSARQQKQEVKHSGLDKIVDNNRVLLVHVKTQEAAVLIGRGTSWCTAYTDRNNRFDFYNSGGPILVVIDKTTNEKFQIHYESAQVMDSYDEAYDYQKLLKIAPQLKQLEPEYSDELVKELQTYDSSIVEFTNTFHKGSASAAVFIMQDSSDAYEYVRDVLKQERCPEVEKYVVKNPTAAYYYVRYVIKDRWPEAEPHIMKDPVLATKYIHDVMGGERWTEAEPYIMKSPESALYYAKTVIKDRWPEAEPYIMEDPKHAYYYISDVLKGERWPEAEPFIMKDNYWRRWYWSEILNLGPWPEAEPYIMKHANQAYDYVRKVIKGRWPEAEPYIMKDPEVAFNYIQFAMGGKRWPEAEPYIMTNPRIAFRYVIEVIKVRWPEAEPYLRKDSFVWNNYLSYMSIDLRDTSFWDEQK